VTTIDVLSWTERLLGFAIALQTLELLIVRHALRDDGAFAWPTLRRTYACAPALLRLGLDGLLAYRPFVGVLVAQLAAALALLSGVAPRSSAVVLVLTGLLQSARFRGPYNGGSDAMTMVVLLGVSIARMFEGERARQIGLGYVAAQLVLSYFVAGVVKLRSPRWRDGSALVALGGAHQYALAPRVTRLLDDRRPSARLGARAACWTLLSFECVFPLALLDRTVCLTLLALGASFHVVNARVLGLNRFLWAWLAAYPALFYWAARSR
jgi:hypothetical protein